MKLLITLLQLQFWPSSISATCIGFRIAAASQAASRSWWLVVASVRVFNARWDWDLGFEFFIYNLDSMIILKSLELSFINLRFLFCNMMYIPLISRRESCNSVFLLVNIALVLLIYLSKTSSSYTFPNSWLILWDLGFLEEASAIGSPWPSLGVGEGNSSCSTVTCFVLDF